MKRYLYVLVLGHGAGEPISFEHAFVEAENHDDAYSAGHKAVPIPEKNGINDYVVELPTSALFEACSDAENWLEAHGNVRHDPGARDLLKMLRDAIGKKE